MNKKFALVLALPLVIGSLVGCNKKSSDGLDKLAFIDDFPISDSDEIGDLGDEILQNTYNTYSAFTFKQIYGEYSDDDVPQYYSYSSEAKGNVYNGGILAFENTETYTEYDDYDITHTFKDVYKQVVVYDSGVRYTLEQELRTVDGKNKARDLYEYNAYRTEEIDLAPDYIEDRIDYSSNLIGKDAKGKDIVLYEEIEESSNCDPWKSDIRCDRLRKCQAVFTLEAYEDSYRITSCTYVREYWYKCDPTTKTIVDEYILFGSDKCMMKFEYKKLTDYKVSKEALLDQFEGKHFSSFSLDGVRAKDLETGDTHYLDYDYVRSSRISNEAATEATMTYVYDISEAGGCFLTIDQWYFGIKTIDSSKENVEGYDYKYVSLTDEELAAAASALGGEVTTNDGIKGIQLPVNLANNFFKIVCVATFNGDSIDHSASFVLTK